MSKHTGSDEALTAATKRWTKHTYRAARRSGSPKTWKQARAAVVRTQERLGIRDAKDAKAVRP